VRTFTTEEYFGAKKFFFGKCREQSLLYNLQLAKRLGLFNPQQTHQICTHVLMLTRHLWYMSNVPSYTQHRKLETVSAFFLTHFGQILVRTGVVHVLVLLQKIFQLSQPDGNWKLIVLTNLKLFCKQLKSALFSCNIFLIYFA